MSEIGNQISEKDVNYNQTSLARTQHIKLGKYEVHCDGPCIKSHIHTSDGNQSICLCKKRDDMSTNYRQNTV